MSVELSIRLKYVIKSIFCMFRSGSIIPLPGKAEETIDYKSKSGYVLNKKKDTAPAAVEEITYEPKLATFEMDVMESMGIQETRIPKKSYWY